MFAYVNKFNEYCLITTKIPEVMKKQNIGIMLPMLAASLLTQAQSNIEHPNVLLIYADDLGYGDLSCYGADKVSTPNVDALAGNGLRFTNAHSVASTSTPSRYALLTGEYPWRKRGTDVAAGNAGMIISPEQYTVADMFKEAGYTTAAFGKWHLGLGAESGKQDWNKPLTVGLVDIGFDHSYIMAATGDRVPCVFIENGRVANYDASAPIYVSYRKNFEGEPTGKNNPELLYNLRHSHGHNMSIVNGIGRIGYMKGGGKALWKDENIADSITTHAIEFLKEKCDTPFFIYFATNDVHVPRFPHERFRGKTGMGHRGDAIAQFDWCVGELVKTLKELDIFENTLIILTSDNGPVIDDGYDDKAEELLGGHNPMGGLRGGKYSCFEAGTRVPFIVHWPARIKRAKERDALVSQIDFLDVMATIAGDKKEENISPDGLKDQAPTWLGKRNKGRKMLFQMAANHNISLRTGKWKYIPPCKGAPMVTWGPKIETGYSSEPQLYRDKSETENRASQHPRKAERMQKTVDHIRTTPSNAKR